MSQASVTNVDKAAILLTRLDPLALNRVLEMLGPEFAGKLRPALAAVAQRRDLVPLTEQVMQEFTELQHDVRASVGGSPVLQQRLPPAPETATPAPPAHGATSSTSPEVSKPAKETPRAGETGKSHAQASQSAEVLRTTDADSLATVPPLTLCAALKPESPRMIAMVLKQLPSDVSGRVLEGLPAEQRQNVFLLMAESVQVNATVVSRVMQRLLEVCRTVDPATAEQQDPRVRSLIGILQAVEREERIRLMESLAERDPELAAQVDDLMYDYTDILRIEDRSVQKLLGQLEQKVVATALKSAPDDLRQKVLKNLSERVRLALNEEMELLTGVNASKSDQARREIANVIRSQDKEGALLWME